MKLEVYNRKMNLIIFVCAMLIIAIFYSNCSSKSNTESNQNTNSTKTNETEPTQLPSNSNYNSNFKLAILSAASGSYGMTCYNVIDNELGTPGSGSVVNLTPSGIISWSGSSLDLMKAKSDKFILIRSYGDIDGSVFSVDVDNENGRSHVVRISSQLAPGSNDYLTNPSIINELVTPTVANLCSDLYKHSFASIEVRAIANKFIHFETTEKTCIKTGNLHFFKGTIAFNSKNITIAGNNFSATAPLSSNSIASNGSSFGYTATDISGNLIQFEINANGGFSYAHWQFPDGSIISCK